LEKIIKKISLFLLLLLSILKSNASIALPTLQVIQQICDFTDNKCFQSSLNTYDFTYKGEIVSFPVARSACGPGGVKVFLKVNKTLYVQSIINQGSLTADFQLIKGNSSTPLKGKAVLQQGLYILALFNPNCADTYTLSFTLSKPLLKNK